MKLTYKVVDNFLDFNDYLKIFSKMNSETFPWHHIQKGVSNTGVEDGSYFVHKFVWNLEQSPYLHLLEPLLRKVDPKALKRVKGNLYPRTEKLFYHGVHTDFEYEHKAMIYFLNTNDGYTVLKKEGVKINSVQNRALFFNPLDEHQSTTCTDLQCRMNINMNYF